MYPRASVHRRSRRLRPYLVLVLAAAAPAFANDNLSLINNALGNVNVTSGPDFFAFDDSAILTPTTIQTTLDASNVSAHTGTSGANSEPGDIFLVNSITGPGNGFG